MVKKQIINERVERNLRVLKLLSNNDPSINEDQKRVMLNEYSGWGGLREAIFTPSIYRQLKCYLTDDEINALKNTTKSAYYTPELLVKFIWSIVVIHGFDGGVILEPAAGNGIFIDNIPQLIVKTCKVQAVEMDLLTCKILMQKHPQIKLTVAPFENLHFSEEKYNLIISNPPYSNQLVEDIYYKDLSHLAIHHFFVAKCARLLKNNGIIAMVLPQFFLDNVREHARDIITADGVNVLVAYRLPDNIFANAKITVDIVILQKAATNIKWQKTRNITIGEHNKPINEYFVENPAHILGELEVVPMYNRMGITCKATGDLREKLKAIFLALKNKNK